MPDRAGSPDQNGKKLTEVLTELDSLYYGYILAFKKSANLKEYKEAANALRAIKNIFPDERSLL